VGWNWGAFRGSQEALRYNRRDLETVNEVLGMVPGRTAVVQAGANLGIFPKWLARQFATVYTFEPDPALFAMAIGNAPEQNIVWFQAALGDKRELVAMSHQRRDGKPNNHEGITHVSGAGNIPTLRIDDLGLPVCDLIYLDLEGWELYALRGAAETIARCRPVLVVEINKSLGFVGISKDEVRGTILAHGYRFLKKMHSDEIYLP
jgi:FkbM family methyltransferase